MTLWAQLRRRWDIRPAPDMPFEREIAQVDVGRIELVCLIAPINNAFEIALGFGAPPIRLEMLVAIGWIVAVQVLRRAGPAVQRIAVIVFIVTAILSAHWAVFDLAARGAIYGGYLLRLLTLALLFVRPPRLLGVLIAFGLASHAAMLAFLPPALPRGKVLANTVIVSAIAYVAGCLIFSARRVEHEQRTLIGAQNARLEAQNAELDQLMAIAAHDLRSPLYGLRNLLDIADRRADADPSLPRRLLRDAIESLDAMQTLVTRLLDAHAAEHAPLGVASSEDLRSAVPDAAARAKPLSLSRGVTIERRLPDAAIYAIVDGSALARILDDLLANAIRHSPAGSRRLDRGRQSRGGHASLGSGPGTRNRAGAPAAPLPQGRPGGRGRTEQGWFGNGPVHRRHFRGAARCDAELPSRRTVRRDLRAVDPTREGLRRTP